MPTFSALWSKHPNVKGDTPLLDKTVYENQCAINLSAAWMRAGMSLTGYTGVLSWEKDKPKYAIRAQELANWFASGSSGLFTKPIKVGGKKAFEDIKNKTGIIFFQNYYGAGNRGDHIDLWNGHRLTHIRSLPQIYLRIGSFGLGSDYRGSESVWFWAVS